MLHIFIDILFVIVIITLVYIVHIKVVKCRKNSEGLIKILTINIEFLDSYYKRREIDQLKKSITLYSTLKIIMNISNCDYVSLYRYNYSKSFMLLSFLVSIDKNSDVLEHSDVDNLPVTSNKIILNILNNHNKNELSSLTIDDVKSDEYVCGILNSHEINKIQYTNILNDKNSPEGFILLSYKDKNYKMNSGGESEVLRISEKLKYLI